MVLVSHSPEKYRHKLHYTTNPNPKHDFSSPPLPPSSTLPRSLSNHVLYFTFQANCGACGYLVAFGIPPVSICDAASHGVCSAGTVWLHYWMTA